MRKPAAAGDVTVTFRLTTFAPKGTPHVPPTAVKRRACAAPSAGPASGASGRRVSMRRQGTRVWKIAPVPPTMVAEAAAPVLAFQYEPLALVSRRTERTW